MKKYVALSFVLLLVFSGCNLLEGGKEKAVEPEVTEEEELNALKEKIDGLSGEEKVPDEAEDENEEVEEPAVEEEPVPEPETEVETEAEVETEENESDKAPEVTYDGPSFIKVTSPTDGAGFTVEPIVFEGEVSPNTEKIIVTQTYADDLSVAAAADIHQLQDFEEGDTEFVYRAKQDWDNLNYGENYYDFKAYFEDGTTETTKVTIDFLYQGQGQGLPFITVDTPKNGTKFVWQDTQFPIEFKGQVPSNAVKIVVKAYGGDPSCDTSQELCSPYYEDIYTLKDFNHGDGTFVYRAKPDWDNLQYGLNTYEFTAHFDSGDTLTKKITIEFVQTL